MPTREPFQAGDTLINPHSGSTATIQHIAAKFINLRAHGKPLAIRRQALRRWVERGLVRVRKPFRIDTPLDPTEEHDLIRARDHSQPVDRHIE